MSTKDGLPKMPLRAFGVIITNQHCFLPLAAFLERFFLLPDEEERDRHPPARFLARRLDRRGFLPQRDLERLPRDFERLPRDFDADRERDWDFLPRERDRDFLPRDFLPRDLLPQLFDRDLDFLPLFFPFPFDLDRDLFLLALFPLERDLLRQPAVLLSLVFASTASSTSSSSTSSSSTSSTSPC